MTHGDVGTSAKSSGFSGPQMNLTSPSSLHSAWLCSCGDAPAGSCAWVP